MNNSRRHIVVIGAGAAGLGAAFLLERAKRAGVDLSYALYEKDKRTGGKVAGETVVLEDLGAEFIIDGGPDCYSAYKPAAMRVARLAGIGDQKLNSQEERKGTFIWRNGKKHPLPQGFSMFVPTQLAPLFETELLSEEGKRGLLSDLTAPVKKLKEGERNDETLESFITRRFNREVLDYLAEPFIGGVHASDPKSMSLAASFPMYLDMEQKYGSVIRGTVMSVKAREEAAAKRALENPNAEKQTIFASFNKGMHQLTDAITAQLDPQSVQIGAAVDSISKQKNGRYLLTLESGETVTADGVVIATESFAGAKLVKNISTELSEAYNGIPNLTSSTCSFAFRAEDVELPEKGFGTLVPAVEERSLLAATWSSTKWSNRAPEGYVLIRGFCGTPHNQELMDTHNDEELTEIVLQELREIMDIKAGAEPLFSRFYRWELGMSQYTIGHLDRVETIERICAETSGLAASGGCFRGVGVPNCLESGESGVYKIFTDLGIEYCER